MLEESDLSAVSVAPDTQRLYLPFPVNEPVLTIKPAEELLPPVIKIYQPPRPAPCKGNPLRFIGTLLFRVNLPLLGKPSKFLI